MIWCWPDNRVTMNSWVIFNCTNIELDINAKPGHTHVAVGKSNAEGDLQEDVWRGVCLSRMCRNRNFLLHHYQRVLLNVCMDLWVFE